MSNSVNDHIKVAFGPIWVGSVSSDTANDLSTTATQLTNATSTRQASARRLRVKNFSSSNDLGIHFTEIDASTPSIDTVRDGGNPAHVILAAGEVEWFTIKANVEVWVVGSAASTEYQATWFEM